MWNVERIEKYLHKLSESKGDTFDIPVKINGRLKTTLGRVHHTYKDGIYTAVLMDFAKNFLAEGTDEDIETVIRHEWSHYYLMKVTKEKHGHNDVFNSLCAEMGGNTGPKIKLQVRPKQKYDLICDGCGHVSSYSRKCRTMDAAQAGYCTCRTCNGKSFTIMQNW